MTDLRDLLSRATPLPWVVNDAQPGAYTRIECEADGYFNDGWVIAAELLGPDAAANAALIVAAVNALPNLLSELDGAREREREQDRRIRKLEAALRVARGYVLSINSEQSFRDKVTIDDALGLSARALGEKKS